LRVSLSLPYYEVRYRRGRRGEARAYLEAFLSRYAGPSEICLLAAPQPGLTGEPRGRRLEPWAQPRTLITHYLSVSSALESARSPGPTRRWILRRMLQEFNRLVAGALAGPPEAPEVDRDALRASLARRLCADTVWKLHDAAVLGHRLLWLPITLTLHEDGSAQIAGSDGRRLKVIEYVVNRSREALQALTRP